MKRGWQVASITLLAFFCGALWLTLYGWPAIRMRPLPLKDALGPGPGFFPLWLSLIGLGLCAALLVEVTRSRELPTGTVYPTVRRNVGLAAIALLAVLAVVLWGFPSLAALPIVADDGVRAGVAGVLACAASLVLAAWPNRPGLTEDEAAFRRMLAIVGLLAVAIALLDPLGFRLTALSFSVLLLWALGIHGPIALTVFALAASIGVFHVFYHWLKVPLPIGLFDHVFKLVGL